MSGYDSWPRAYGGTRIPPEQIEQDIQRREKWKATPCSGCEFFHDPKRATSGRIVGICKVRPGYNMCYSDYGCESFSNAG